MARRLRVGVIGLGRRWARRYRPALLALADRYEVAAVCDQIPQRTLAEADRLGCAASAGPADLVAAHEVEAVVLVDAQWFGLWPLGRAAGLGKPVFCAAPPERDAAHAEALVRQVERAKALVMMGWGPAVSPAFLYVPELLSRHLGPPRLVVGEWGRRGRAGLGRGAGSVLAYLFGLIGRAPERVVAAGEAPAGLTTVAFACGEGTAVQLSSWHAPGRKTTLRVRVVAERGQATLAPGRRLAWEDATGRHALTLPRAGSATVPAMLECFHESVTSGQAPRPGIAEVHAALKWLDTAFAGPRP